MDAEALRGARLPPSPHFPGAAPGAALLGGDGDRAGCGGAPEQPPRWFRFEPRFPGGASFGAGRFGGSHPEGHGGRGGWRCRCPRCPLSPAAGPFAVPSLWSLRCPLPSPRRGTRRSSRRFLSAPKRTEWKFNRPLVCVVEISGSCFGIFYDTFVYVGES